MDIIMRMLQFERGEKITAPPGKVAGIIPIDGSIHIQLDQIILWSRPAMAQTYDVYIGETAETLIKVSTAQAARVFVPTLELDTTYYIRIDSKNTLGMTTGDVVSFSTWASTSIETDELGAPLTDEEGRYLETNII